VREYVADLEAVLVQTLAGFGIHGRGHPKHRGVWIDKAGGWEKIAAIGVRISGGISSHGFALNVAPDMNYFSGIIPCGLKEYGVTSMAVELDQEINIEQVLPHLTASFDDIFNLQMASGQKRVAACDVPLTP
jgi:lipoate-protein ligase B